MKRRCNELWSAMVDLAEGRDSQEAQLHLEGCSECRQKLAEVRKMMDGFAVTHFSAPDILKARAKSLMQATRTRLTVIRSSFAFSGARSAAAQDFQVVYGGSGVELRVLYAKGDRGWDVMAQVPGEGWTVERGGKDIGLDSDGRFHFLAKTLEDSGFSLSGPGLFDVPAAAEALRESRNDA